jgi:hypothetical protein
MKFPWAVTVALLGVSLSGWAQQNNTFKAKNSTPEKKSSSRVATPATVSGDPSKDLRALERQQAKASAPTSAGKTRGTASALKPVQEKPNSSMNLKGSGEGKIPHKSSGLKSNRGKDPYAGRLRQKHARQ